MRIPYLSLLLVLGIIAGMAGCSSDNGPCGNVTLIFSSDRNWTGKPGQYFGTGRVRDTFGQVDVGVLLDDRPSHPGRASTRPTRTLPSTARTGILAKPTTFCTSQQTDGAILKAFGSARQKRVLIFVHGFNVSYAGACQAAAQLAYDVDYPGVAMAFDWPSMGSLFKYSTDEETAQWAAPHLTHLLRRIHATEPEAKIDIVCHSMGSRVVTYALRELECENVHGQDSWASSSFGHVIFLAPDIDVDIFRETTMQYIHSLSTYTVYGSSNDQALRVSKWIHDHKREGERPDRYTIDYPADHKPPGRWFESVDASSTDTSLIGHFYYDGSVAQVTLDLAGVLNDREKERPSVWNAGGTFREFSTTQK